MTASPVSVEPPRPRVVARWVDPRLPRIWQVGYVVEGEFRPWAGGSSEEALRSFVEKERKQSPDVDFEDRRRTRPGRGGW